MSQSHRSPLGRALVIANPAARSGKGAEGAAFAERFLGSFSSASAGFEVRRTQAAGDAEHLARKAHAEGFDTVITLGGDGVIHETVNGLMALPERERPCLAVLPLGTGNDFGRTLGMALNDVEGALAQIIRGQVCTYDIGHVNGVYFMETLSFGLDAAIAHDTTARRAADTSQHGENLYVTSGLKIFARARKGWKASVSLDGESPLELPTLIFAVQLGPTYGGGFPICPDARPDDGVFDICMNVKRPLMPHIMALFAMARSGRHVNSSVIKIAQAKRIAIHFETEPPAQADGEWLEPVHDYSIEIVPRGLRVIAPDSRTSQQA
ncbi:diacylglycerol kinase family lipid kinase [Collinsella sp. zg1085]|uniref:diacylglycerol/lipid kinase family protein n=1 Tax=Collinsella sp. zg1085 TaxID=2844380 RepID=UPI001C0E82A5|nr:diacylglycerol kinase family protein [Collinsella sp. zg1085]QWT17856.1 diacylglycerol kinase family lipid kinase [Collinsella sp. zg1085]